MGTKGYPQWDVKRFIAPFVRIVRIVNIVNDFNDLNVFNEFNSMLSINDLTSGSLVLIDGVPFQILEVTHQHIGRGGSSIQTKIRNVKTGQVLSKNFKPADKFKEADIEKRQTKFIYEHRGEYIFRDPKDAKKRFPLSKDVLGDNAQWLKPNIELTVLFLDDEPINVILPIKIDFKVTEAPPGIQGDRSQAGTKAVTLETGAIIQVPLFINQDDVIRINTETGEYTERIEKA